MPLRSVSQNKTKGNGSRSTQLDDKAGSAYARGSELLDHGDYPGAEIELRKSLAYFNGVLDEDDIRIFRNQYKLGAALVRQEKYVEGHSLIQQAVQGTENLLGPDHRDTLASKHFLGVSFCLQRRYVMAEKYLREAWQGRKEILGFGNEFVFDSEHELGIAVFKQSRYDEAEAYFREVWQERKGLFGANDTPTLDTEHWLGSAIFEQSRYDEAEKYFREVWHVEEKCLGSDNIVTLESKTWVIEAVYGQARYQEAESFLRELLPTIETRVDVRLVRLSFVWKILLGRSLYEQERFDEAVTFLEMALPEQETILDDGDVLYFSALYCLGKALCRQERYSEAESHLQRTVQAFEKASDSNVDFGSVERTFNFLYMSKYWLSYSLEQQGKEPAADLKFQSVAEQYGKLMSGLEAVDVCRCNYWLGKTLFEQKKYHDAEQYLRQAIQGGEHAYKHLSQALLTSCLTIQLMHARRVEGMSRMPEHRTTPVESLDNKINSEETLPKTSSTSFPEITTRSTSASPTTRLDVFFGGNDRIQPSYTDFEISEISSLLKHLKPDWSRVPRLYIVLRLIDCLHLLDDFITNGFSDYWFPASEQRLPQSLSPSQRQKFVDAQVSVLTESLQLEKGVDGRHCYFSESKSLPLEKQRIIGRGGFGQVDQVLSLISYKIYARKRVLRGALMRGRRPELLKLFVTEIETLKRLQHRHIVEFVGSYSDSKYLGLLIHPVAEMDLSTYFTLPDVSTRLCELRTFYGCLATALAFLHEEKVRHKDIKPQNILVNRGNILLTDFGLALDFTEAQGSTTISMVSMMTLRYCAPEVVEQEPRGTSSDIWSLGIVFLEMLVILKGKTIEYMDGYFADNGSGRPYVRTNYPTFSELLLTLAGLGDKSDNRVIEWIRDMLQKTPKSRPKAHSIMTSINEPISNDSNQTKFGGICCMPHDDDYFSDFSE